GAARHFGENCGMARRIRQFTHCETAEFEEVLLLEFCSLTETNHNEPFSLELRRDNEFQRRVSFAGKALDLRGPPYLVDNGPQASAVAGADFQPLAAEDNENPLRWGGERAKAKFDGVRHRLNVLFLHNPVEGRGAIWRPPATAAKTPQVGFRLFSKKQRLFV